MQSEMVRFPWQRGVPSSHSVQTKSFFHVARGGGSCAFARPCLTGAPMLCEVHNYWRPCVKRWCLLRAATSVCSNKSAYGREQRRSSKQANLSLMKYPNAQQEVAHKQTLTIWDPVFDGNYAFGLFEFHTCMLIFKCRFRSQTTLRHT